MVTLEDLKTKRTTEKRKVTQAYNVLLLQAADGYDEDLENQLKKLSHAFTGFVTAYDAYAAGLEREASAAGHALNGDYIGLDDYFKDVESKLRRGRAEVNFIKAREEFEDDWEHYRVIKGQVLKALNPFNDKTVAEIKADEGAKVLHDRLKPKVEKFEKHFNDLFLSSLKDFKKACQPLKKKIDEEKAKIGFDAREDDSENILHVFSKLTAAIRALEVDAEEKKVATRGNDNQPAPIKLEKVENLRFDGEYRSWAAFIKEFRLLVHKNRDPTDIGMRLKQAMPAKWKHLIANLEPHKFEEMEKVLEEKFGNQRHIISACTNEIDSIKMPTTDEAYILMYQKLEKIHSDCQAVGLEASLDHPEMVKKIEKKLPDLLKDKWLDYCVLHKLLKNNATQMFPHLVEFMKSMYEKADYVVGDPANSSQSSQSRYCSVTAVSTGAQAKSHKVKVDEEEEPPRDNKKLSTKPCLACHTKGATITDKVRHKTSDCKVWKGLSYEAKKKLVSCLKHPHCNHNPGDENCSQLLKRFGGVKCQNCQSTEHSTLLCDKKPSNNSYCKSATTTSSCYKSLVKTLIVKGKADEEIGVMEDPGSTDSFVLTARARGWKLKGEPLVLQLEGINETKRVETELFKVPIRDKFGKLHYVECYGLDEISSCELPDQNDYAKLCEKFKVSPDDVRRPPNIDLLLSVKDNFLMSDTVVGDMDGIKLYSGPLGMCFMGDMGSDSRHQSYPVRATRVMKARTVPNPLSNRDILQYFKEENIGADCNPKCGGCRCGKCATGSQQMSIKEEKLYARFKKNMHLDIEGTPEDPGPYWVTNYPWNVPREDLANNYPAVLGVMNATAKKLNKDKQWRQQYEQQLRALVDMNFAEEVDPKEIKSWVKNGGKSYFIAHQMVIDDGNKTSPIRCVFNSSQVFQGSSLNGSWELGPDMTGSLNAILLRFRENLIAAQGDIRKMYYAVRVPLVEQMMQLWVWQFDGDPNIRIFRMKRLVMGNRPSANISQIALKETAHLNNNAEEFPAAKEALTSNSYVDNVFLGDDNEKGIKEKIKETEHVAGMGGFNFKPWVVSYQDVSDVQVGPGLPPAYENTEKALGVFWNVKLDKLFIKVQIEGKKRKIVISLNNFIENPALKLTVRCCLSLHARCYDPIGLILPVKMVGNLLFRETIQSLAASRQEGETKLPWDKEVTDELRDSWLDYFKMLEGIKDVSFPRSVKPASADPSIKPTVVTFSDGNMNAFGAVAYLLWTLEDGSKEARLVTSKAKLGPLLGKGEVVKNELSGATFAVRIKSWIIENSTLNLSDHLPFVDSQIVQHMVKKEDYHLNTFAGLRVKEIGQKSDVTSWLHIPSKDNYVSDILTKGADPSSIKEGSEWQCGPKWLTQPPDTWPVTHVNLNKEERETVKSFEKVTKVFKTKSHRESSTPGPRCQGVAAGPDYSNDEETFESWMDKLVNNVSSLTKIVKIVAIFLRLGGRDPASNVKFEPVSASQYSDALKVIIKHEQRNLDTKKFNGFDISERDFVLNSGKVISLAILQTRVKNFPAKFDNHQDFVFPLPTSTFAKRIASFYHQRFHRDVDTVVMHIRKEFWIVGLRRIVTVIDRNCIQCIMTRQQVASQLMGNLPTFRTDIISAFAHSSLDLFGPIWIKDAVIRRGGRGHKVMKKVYGALFACLASRAIYLDIADDYSTQAILHCLRRFQADKGQVSLLVSDPGSQLVGAKNELEEVRSGWSQEELIRFGAENGMEWRFTMSASAHQNGVTEILVKLVKGIMASLMSAMGTSVLNLNELFTVFKEVANLANERPIGLKPNTQTDPAFLSPNSLLLGRSGDRVSSGPFQSKIDFKRDPNSDRTRFLLVQKITSQFWKVWTKTFFPTLLRRPKWHQEKRNMKVDDICLLKDSNAFRGEWRKCRVVTTMPDEDKRVRNVEVTVPPPALRLLKGLEYPKHLAMNSLKRHVSNLIVLVPSDEGEHDEDKSLAGSVKVNAAASPEPVGGSDSRTFSTL